uniref:Uncharacterized protein n=1 Tax=Sphaerodactylus townsendi TaxID=933632 RepID=A0ACB8FBZ4_9SAUR
MQSCCGCSRVRSVSLVLAPFCYNKEPRGTTAGSLSWRSVAAFPFSFSTTQEEEYYQCPCGKREGGCAVWPEWRPLTLLGARDGKTARVDRKTLNTQLSFPCRSILPRECRGCERSCAFSLSANI